MAPLLVCEKLVFLCHASMIVTFVGLLVNLVTLHHESMKVMSPEPMFEDLPGENQSTGRSGQCVSSI